MRPLAIEIRRRSAIHRNRNYHEPGTPNVFDPGCFSLGRFRRQGDCGGAASASLLLVFCGDAVSNPPLAAGGVAGVSRSSGEGCDEGGDRECGNGLFHGFSWFEFRPGKQCRLFLQHPLGCAMMDLFQGPPTKPPLKPPRGSISPSQVCLPWVMVLKIHPRLAASGFKIATLCGCRGHASPRHPFRGSSSDSRRPKGRGYSRKTPTPIPTRQNL